MRLIKTPCLLTAIMPWAEWKKTVNEKVLYLTFDDGPVPEATPFVMDQLERFNALATFFCVGENASRYPDLIQQLLDKGHRIGNHTFNHLDGWKTAASNYLENIEKCAKQIESDLFRPPYGKINPLTIHQIKKHYRIILWDVVSYDFDHTLAAEECISLTYAATKPGSIIVFHDSPKSMPRLIKALPALLERWTAEGYSFKTL